MLPGLYVCMCQSHGHLWPAAACLPPALSSAAAWQAIASDTSFPHVRNTPLPHLCPLASTTALCHLLCFDGGGDTCGILRQSLGPFARTSAARAIQRRMRACAPCALYRLAPSSRPARPTFTLPQPCLPYFCRIFSLLCRAAAIELELLVAPENRLLVLLLGVGELFWSRRHHGYLSWCQPGKSE